MTHLLPADFKRIGETPPLRFCAKCEKTHGFPVRVGSRHYHYGEAERTAYPDVKPDHNPQQVNP